MARRNPELLVLTNPLRTASKAIKNALRSYLRFHWRTPARIDKVKVPGGINAKTLIRIGEVDEIRYSTGDDSERTKISKHWVHTFKNKPHLCTTPRGDVIIIFGGGLKVTPRGIEG